MSRFLAISAHAAQQKSAPVLKRADQNIFMPGKQAPTQHRKRIYIGLSHLLLSKGCLADPVQATKMHGSNTYEKAGFTSKLQPKNANNVQ
ncbi:hypothetical protein TH4_14790 [Thalassospira tepidiphila MCCC 1A03514]|uniref:Uncharacterized protein n=1 Tax=Thalassospira tepidiphila MCCC 1A03514 TaxID=1177930 RepID=A0A853KZ42_9PROT|nr:hypothetical protein TH4_14790 [Thalassospira tepidiphila MCCC 1A03514]